MAAQETKKAWNVSEAQSGVLIITVSHLTCFQVHSLYVVCTEEMYLNDALLLKQTIPKNFDFQGFS